MSLEDIRLGYQLATCGIGRQILARALSVVPAQIGDANWNIFASDYDVTKPGTSCAFLVRYALSPWFDTRGGLESIRTQGRDIGAWVEGDSGKRPCPGSAYLLESVDRKQVLHVGITDHMTKSLFFSVDAGQGVKPDQRANRVTRELHRDGKRVFLTYLGATRYLAGWLDPRQLTPHWYTPLLELSWTPKVSFSGTA